MSINDQIILDKLTEQKRSELAPDLETSQFFEIFTASEIVKDYDITYEEVQSGIVGDGGDAGVDAIFTFANGELAEEDTDWSALKRGVQLDLVIIQAKTAPSFGEAVLDKFMAFTRELLDLSQNLEDLINVYNSKILGAAKIFRDLYTNLASRFPKLNISFHYASRSSTEPHSNVIRKAELLKAATRSLYTTAGLSVSFAGASELLRLARKMQNSTYTLNLAENPISSSGATAFVCLVGLQDYYRFITTEQGQLSRNIFESNVRDFQGETEVNEAIANTLSDDRSNEFWWLNNGVTVLATQATSGGKVITLENPQIVNGLQTSTVIYNYFRKGTLLEEKRNLLVRVIVPPVSQSRDVIIKATNSQTPLPAASLRATETIHRDIEEYLRSGGYFYDRRKNQYRNEGKPLERVIGISHLAQAVMAIALRRPDDARSRPSSLLKTAENYRKVFSEDYPIRLYMTCTVVLKRVNKWCQALESKDKTNLRFYIALDVTCRALGTASPPMKQIAELDHDLITEQAVTASTEYLSSLYFGLGGTDQVAKGKQLLDAWTSKNRLSN